MAELADTGKCGFFFLGTCVMDEEIQVISSVFQLPIMLIHHYCWLGIAGCISSDCPSSSQFRRQEFTAFGA